MLREYHHVSQQRRHGFRRWFQDDIIDLTLWYTTMRRFMGFQVCYWLDGFEYALTWYLDRGPFHNRIATMRIGGGHPGLPELTHDGVFPKELIAELFRERSQRVDEPFRKLVLDVMKTYPGRFRLPPEVSFEKYSPPKAQAHHHAN